MLNQNMDTKEKLKKDKRKTAEEVCMKKIMSEEME